MASMTRTELKDIVKECIMEVLLEGLDASAKPVPTRQTEQVKRAVGPIPIKRAPDASFSTGASKVANQAQGRRQALPHAVSALASEFHGEQRNVMQQIFEDTARNTLPSQMTAERSPGAALAERADLMSPVSDVDPMSLFDGASNWAELAFSSKNN